MNASRMMAKMTATSQKKNMTMPGMAYPATSLVLATAPGYPAQPDLFRPIGTPARRLTRRRSNPPRRADGWVSGEEAAYAEARLAVGPLAGPRHPPLMPSPARLIRLINRSYDDRRGG